MVINVTEQQKNVIESQGYMVVEFKAWAKRFFEWSNKRQIIDTWNLVMNFLVQKAREAALNLAEVFADIKEKLEPMIEVLDDLGKERFDYEPRRKYLFVRSLGRKYKPNFSYRVIYHRCRDRC